MRKSQQVLLELRRNDAKNLANMLMHETKRRIIYKDENSIEFHKMESYWSR